MSLQAELAAQLLMRLYQEFDQHSGWCDPEKVVAAYKGDGVAEGRIRDALKTLSSLRMLEHKDESTSIKISSYGVDWIEKNCPLVSRNPYAFSMPMFRTLKLTGPDEFYKRKRSSGAPASDAAVYWTKVGVYVAAVIGIITIAVTKGWL